MDGHDDVMVDTIVDVVFTDVSTDPPGRDALVLEMVFVSDERIGCSFASPLLVTSRGVEQLLVITSSGELIGLDLETATPLWTFTLPAPEGQMPFTLSTPAVLDERVVIGWQDVPWDQPESPADPARLDRTAHHVGVFDLETREMSTRYSVLTLAAEVDALDGSGSVRLVADEQLLRSQIHHLHHDERDLVYVSLGNGPSIQPYHGWVFEIDLGAWESDPNSAVAAVLNTTRENDCEAGEGEYDTMVCGGGVWTTAGLQIYGEPDAPELLIPTGNGRIDFDIGAYANAILRVEPGLDFDPECDETLCADFDELDPSIACLESCRNVFVPRLMEGQSFEPEHGLCEGQTFVQCMGVLDADFGASAPLSFQIPDGPRVIVHPGKDGALYMIDYAHMGTLHDRVQALEVCGTETDTCRSVWAGMFVTQPVVTEIDGSQIVLVAGHMFDDTHPAGVMAYRIVMEDEMPRFEAAWTFPDFSDETAVERFRAHPSRITLTSFDGVQYALVVETVRSGSGRLYLLRVRDGELISRADLTSHGTRYIKPLIVGDRVYVPSCHGYRNTELNAFELRWVDDGDVDAGTDASVSDAATDANDELGCEPAGTACNDDEWCERPIGMGCFRPGLCRARPTSCDEPGEPICGCDGVTYSTACHATMAGISIAELGSCP